MASCALCGATLPEESHYCPQCGNRADAGGTKVMSSPDETGHVPVHYRQAEARYYGVTPATLVLGLAGAALTLAVVLLSRAAGRSGWRAAGRVIALRRELQRMGQLRA
ncbi:hypothetical protein BH18ACT12_BH18ACT12_09320 [soil metagenome]